MKEDGEPLTKSFTMLKGRDANLRWLEVGLNVKVRSLNQKWPLQSDHLEAQEKFFCKRTRTTADG